MLHTGLMLRPGENQVPRQTLRHWPVLAAAVTAVAVAMAVFAFTGRPAARHTLRIAAARSRLAAYPDAPPPGVEAVTAGPDHVRGVLHLVAAPAVPVSYVVRAGDTLSRIAHDVGGHASYWPELWAKNRSHVHNPAALTAGIHLALPHWRPVKPWLLKAALAAIPQPVVRRTSAAVSTGGTAPAGQGPVPVTVTAPVAGIYSYSALEALWVSAGGPAAAEAAAATIAECESGGNPQAYNPSGASGLWQILGNPFPGDPFDPATNARMAVAKYDAAGGFSPWVCQA